MWMIRTALVFGILHNVLSQNNTEVTSVIIDLMRKLHFPMKILPSVCWSSGHIIKFQKQIFNEIHSMSTSKPDIDVFPHSCFEEHCLIVVDLRCSHSRNILLKANKFNLLRQPYKWIAIGDSEEIIKSNIYVRLDTAFYVINDVIRGSYEISTLYRLRRNSSFIESTIGIWNTDEGFQTYKSLSIPRDRVNLQGMSMYIPYVATNPDTAKHLDDYRQKHIDPIAKVNYKIVSHLTDYVNVKPQWIERSTWGYRNETTGLYSGMIGDLQSGASSIGGTPCFFTEDRISAIDFIAATTPTFMKFIFRAPPLSFVKNVFIMPFHVQVWKCYLLTVVVIGIVIFIIVMWEWKDPNFRCRIDNNPSALRPDMLDVVMMEIGAITQQGTEVEPKSSAGRIATIITFVVLMFLYTSYSANIVALLQSTSDSIETLDDILKSRMKLGVEDIVYAHHYFEHAEEPVRKAIYEQKIAPKGQKSNYMTTEEGVARMRNEFFGFHVEVSKGYKVVSDMFQEHEKCGLQEIAYVNLIEPWLAVKKNSSYKEILKAGLRKIHESGLQSREVNRIYTRKPVCHNKGSNFGSVGLIDCYFAFVMFSMGILLCSLILVLELFLNRYVCVSKNNDKVQRS